MKPDIRKASELLAELAERNKSDLRYYLAAAVLSYFPIRKSTIPDELKPLWKNARRENFVPDYVPIPHRPKNLDDEQALKAMAKLMLQEYISRPKVWLDEAVTAILDQNEDVMPVARAAREALRLKPDDYQPSGWRTLASKFSKNRELYTLWAADEIFQETVLKTRDETLY